MTSTTVSICVIDDRQRVDVIADQSWHHLL